MAKLASENFWKVIRDIDWRTHFDVDESKKRMNASLRKCPGYDKKQFKNEFEILMDVIRKETDSRDYPKGIFSPDVSHGADDCCDMDMPAHLIGLGRGAVKKYLEGTLIMFTPVECLLYMFSE